MRILITTLLLCISAVLFAQVPTSFQGTLNIYQSSGTSPNYEIRGVFNDTQGRYTADSADVGDKIFILDGANCVELEITSIISTTGGILRCNVTDVDAVLVNPPLATGAIMEPTPNYGFPTFVDGISNDLLACIRTHFTLLVDNISSGGGGGITGVPGNTQDTVVQTGHGLSLLDPVFVNTSGNWILSNISDEDSCHMAIVTEVISADTLIITYNGLTTQPGHGYTVGSVYFVQDDGTYATTVPTNFINDIAFYVVSDSTLYITEQRIVSPMTDLNGIYSTSDTIPDGTIATGDEFKIQGKTNTNYEFGFWPSNDNIYIKSDSVLLTFSSSEAVFRDYKTVPTGIEYNDSGYVTNPLSLTTKEYVDNAIAAIPTDNIYTADGTTTDANRVVEVINNISFVDTLTNEFGVKITTPLFSEEVAIGRLDATSGTKVTLSESKNTIELRGNATDPLKLSFREETAQGTNFSTIRARDTLASNTDFILPNSNGTYAQVLTTDGQGRTSWTNGLTDGDKGDITVSGNGTNWQIDTGAVTTTEILDGTITTSDLAFTPLQGSGAANQVAVYNGANSLTSYATYTFNGTDNLTYYNTGLSQFTLGRFYLKYDSINTAQQFLLGSTSRILSLPRSNSNGMILYPAADNSTTTSALVLSTGRTDVTDNSVMAINTPQYIGSLTGNTYALNINNTITQNGTIDVSNGIAGGINIQQTQPVPPDNTNQKTEYYGIRLAPSLTRNVGSSDNLYGMLLTPTLSGSSTRSAWRGIYNTTSSGFFIYDNGGANNYFAGKVTIAHTPYTDYRLLVSRNSGTNPLSNFSNVNAYIQVKGSSVRSIRSDNTVYYTFPTIMTVAGATSPHEITNLGTSSLSRAAILAGASPHNSTSSLCYAIVGHVGLQASSTSSYTMEAVGVQGVSEYILNTANSGDENLKGSSVHLYAIRGDSKMSQNYTNGIVNLYSGYFNGNGVSTVSGSNVTNNFGIYTSATGGISSNWSIFSDDGNHYFEDSLKVGGSVAVPTAMIQAVGASNIASGNAFLAENSDGNDIIRARNDLRVALGNNVSPANAWVTVAASTTAGASINVPAGTAPTSPQIGDVWTDNTQKVLATNQSGINQSINGTLFTGTADATVANTVTETTLIPTGVGTVTLPANFLVAGKTIKIDAWGIWTADASPSTLELRAELGGTLLCTTGANTMVTCEGGQWHAEIIFTCRSTGVSGTTYSQGEVRMSSAVSTDVTYWMRRSATNTINTTISNAIDLTATHGAADPDNSITLTNVTITVLN